MWRTVVAKINTRAREAALRNKLHGTEERPFKTEGGFLVVIVGKGCQVLILKKASLLNVQVQEKGKFQKSMIY